MLKGSGPVSRALATSFSLASGIPLPIVCGEQSPPVLGNEIRLLMISEHKVADVLDDIEGVVEQWLSLEHIDTRKAWGEVQEAFREGRERLGLK